LGFAFDEGQEALPVPENLREPNPARPLPRPKTAKGGFMGMSRTQVTLLAGMLIVECCIVAGFGIFMYINP
jgi:hypothetical protein